MLSYELRVYMNDTDEIPARGSNDERQNDVLDIKLVSFNLDTR